MGWSLGLVGLLECLEAAIAKEPRDFFPHLQNGIPDVVVGALITLSLGGGAAPPGPAAGGVSHRQGHFPPRSGPNDESAAENHGPGGRGDFRAAGLLDLGWMAVGGGLVSGLLLRGRNWTAGLVADAVGALAESQAEGFVSGGFWPTIFQNRTSPFKAQK